MRGRPDIISPEGREAIAAYLKEHGARKIPQGVSGFSDKDYAMGGKANRHVFQQKRGRKPDLERRSKYRALVADGANINEISAGMGVTVRHAYVMLGRFGLKAASLLAGKPHTKEEGK